MDSAEPTSRSRSRPSRWANRATGRHALDAEPGRRFAGLFAWVLGRHTIAIVDRVHALMAGVHAGYALLLVALLLVAQPPSPQTLIGAACLLAASGSVLLGARAGRRRLPQDAREAALLLAAGALLDAPSGVEFVLLLSAGNAALYHRLLGRVITLALFGLALMGPSLVTGAAPDLAMGWSLPRFVVVVVVFGFVADVARFAERRLVEEQLLGSARTTLTAGLDVDGMGGVLATVAHDLVARLGPRGGDRAVCVTLLLDGGRLRVSGSSDGGATVPTGLVVDRPPSGPLADASDSRSGGAPASDQGSTGAHALDHLLGPGWWATALPLAAGGASLGALLIAAPTGIDPSRPSALDVLLTEAALALDARRQEAERARREQLLHTVLAESSDLVLVLDHDLVVRYASPAVAQLGWAAEHLEGQDLTWLLHPDDRLQASTSLREVVDSPGSRRTFEARVRDARGHWHVLETVATDHRGDPELRGILLNSRAITERKALEDQLALQAHTDSLTGLLNRTSFEDRVGATLEAWRAWHPPPAVLYIDLDNLKQVNDAYGHWAGDELLSAVAQRLRASTRGGDAVSRLGGDEFAVLLTQANRATVERVADRVLSGIRNGPIGPGHPRPEASMGVAIARPGWTVTQLLQAADAAMYEVKRAGKGTWRHYDDALPSPQDQSALLTDLGLAIEHDDITVHYQPLVSLPGRDWVAVEALARWTHSERGAVPPAEFVHLAERAGLISDLGRRVLSRGLADLARWRTAGVTAGLQVNVSGTQLLAPNLVEEVALALERAGVPPSALTLEITETTLIQNVDRTREALDSLRALGVRLSIDDFGAGYAGLGYLRDLPVDELKIDRSYIASLGHSHEGTSLVRTVVDLAHVLGLEIVAEGVEHEPQARTLIEMGCTRAQGFLFGGPTAEGPPPERGGEEHSAADAGAQEEEARARQEEGGARQEEGGARQETGRTRTP
ncbi:EAL domain-containing protein [Egibacter rhizosphaerae]|uniref:EAL domain-containing protein n=1 Tax=Egibacter rhizosphaerae TaxID=1670831 RepID=A0A411YDF5_9ACTN|nr:EAL domain-containing protein [Egibacter rhizosphaerae]QBI19230.1 EAL domain-containing protein [Egibacter rhizosphaerae]